MNGIERIRVLSSEIKDNALLKIIEYLLSREDMNEKYLNEDKSLKQMVDFIKTLAQKEAKNGMAMIEDEVVYGWAIHYWDESNESLKLEKAKIEKETEKEEPEKIVKKPTKKKSSIDTTEKWKAEGQLTLFDLM